MAQDLRSFLTAIEDDLLTISKEVRLDDVGALISQSDRPIMFESITDYPGWTLCDLFFRSRREQALVLDTEPERFVKDLATVIDAGPGDYREVSDGPVKERALLGEDADLESLPVPVHSQRDPGPYLTGYNVVKDPDTGVQNSCVPRTLVKGPRSAISSFVTPHTNAIMSKYEDRGETMPQAIVIGGHPAFELAVNYSGHHDTFSELQLASTILGETVDFVPCETVDLLVPAQAEIVIEGHIHPTELGADGPSPAPTLYFEPPVQQQPRFEVTAITTRKSPIYRHFQSTTFTDHQPLPRLFHEATLYRRLDEMGLTVHDVCFPAWGGAISVIIQATPFYDGQVNDALLMAMGAPWLNTKMVIVVDEDVDLYDSRDVYWAMATRVNPDEDVIIIPNTRGNPMDPSANPIPGVEGAQKTVGKWGIDATKPPDYRQNNSKFDRAWPRNWGEVDLDDYTE